MKLYIARHTSVDVPQGTCYGHTDIPLRNTFNEEAEAVKQKLDGLHFDKVYTSPLSRCTRLASFCGFENAIKEKRIMEINFGEWEMKPFDSIIDPRLQDWFNDFIHVRPTGGESFIDLYGRVTQFLEELFGSIKENPKTIVTVDVPNQTITNEQNGKTEHFELNGYKKYCLTNGLDDIDFLLQTKEKIEAWEMANK